MVSFCISTNIQTAARTLGGEEASLKRSQPCSPRASFLAGGLEMGPQTIAMSIQCAAGTPDADQCRNAITKTTGLRTLGPVLRTPGAHTAPLGCSRRSHRPRPRASRASPCSPGTKGGAEAQARKTPARAHTGALQAPQPPGPSPTVYIETPPPAPWFLPWDTVLSLLTSDQFAPRVSTE